MSALIVAPVAGALKAISPGGLQEGNRLAQSLADDEVFRMVALLQPEDGRL